METLELRPARRAAGTVRLPGSKSISNRVLLLAALAEGETEIRGLLDADDTQVMKKALITLGCELKENRIKGVGGPFPVNLGPRRPGDAEAIVADSAKIRARLGWEPKLANLDLIVTHALAWERRLVAEGNRA